MSKNQPYDPPQPPLERGEMSIFSKIYPHFQARRASAKRQKAGGRRQKGRKVIVQAFEPFLTG
ncbi:MAG: hypothetical protein F6K17_28595 [Okeania sp. SIO3C4]|nr:hypothetical protein [Okeania sp. SIO3C4]